MCIFFPWNQTLLPEANTHCFSAAINLHLISCVWWEKKLNVVASPTKPKHKTVEHFPKTQTKKPAHDCKQNAAKQIYVQIQTAVSYQNWGPLNRFYGSSPLHFFYAPPQHFRMHQQKHFPRAALFLSYRSRSRNGALLHHNRGNFSNHHVKANKQ